MLTIDTDMPSGNILLYSVDNRGVVHLELNKEYDTITHWFFLKVINPNNSGTKTFEFIIDNAGDSPFKNGWINYAVFYSKDNINWQRLSNGEFVKKSYKFKVISKEKEFYLSWYPPYHIERYKNWINMIDNKKLFIVERNNSLPDYLEIGNKNNPVLLITARQHPGETMASYVIEGIVSEIINNEKIFKKIKSCLSLVIFPLLNKSGVMARYHRYNSCGIDLNRQWKSNAIPEVSFVKNKLKEYKKILAIIDIHGDEISKLSYVFCDVNSNQDFNANFIEHLKSSTPRIIPFPTQSFIKRFFKNLIKKRSLLLNHGITLSEYGRKVLKTNAYTIEVGARETTDKDCFYIGKTIITGLVESASMVTKKILLSQQVVQPDQPGRGPLW